jgi:hypothetical protein
MTLQPGDMIATGTPEGLADVVPGDEVIVEVEGVGRLVIELSAKRNSSPRKRGLSTMIKHWINGREVESKDVFINYNPATGEAIGEVASGGADEVAQAVAAAKEAFPKWANTPAKERARLMRKLGELIEQNVPHLAELETLDTGLPIHQTKNVLIPRASHNFDFFAEVCTHGRPQLPGR